MVDTLKDAGNRANPNTLPNFFEKVAIASVLRGQIPQCLRNKAGDGGNSSQLATLETLALPEDARANFITRASARTGTGAGPLTVVAYGVTPGSGEIAVAPNGDIVMLTADNNEGVDVTYIPERGDVVELTLSTPASVLTIPAALTARGVIALLYAEAVTAAPGLTGEKIILIPGAAPATTKANLNVAKTQVLFNVATDLVTKATVRLLVAAEKDLDDLLAADATIM